MLFAQAVPQVREPAGPGASRLARSGAAVCEPAGSDELGNVRAIVYGQVGRIVMELFFYSPATFDKSGATSSAIAQLRRLPV